MADESTLEPCPCGLPHAYMKCCGAIHRGARLADTPELLMRSRYAAFVRGEEVYLWHTLHPSHDDHARGRDGYCGTIRANAQAVKYRGLQVLDTSPEDGDGVAQVLFMVKLEHRGRDASFVELSSFARQDGTWRYLMGTPLPRRGISLDGLDTQAFLALLERR